MSTKEIHDLVLETLCSEVSTSPDTIACKWFSKFKTNHMYLECGYKEYYSPSVEGQFAQAGEWLNKIQEVTPIPETIKQFTAYWKAASENTPDTLQFPNIE